MINIVGIKNIKGAAYSTLSDKTEKEAESPISVLKCLSNKTA